ncbi:acyl-CoA dehydrogenase family protein [Candidatus Poriferisodalis sp.]|uniref:acyl-CoA dehydrogenase family protein n=1 Tax=Candidatus Poriferisodalis sp. TaxID=3101277 RepID=UPI003B515B54
MTPAATSDVADGEAMLAAAAGFLGELRERSIEIDRLRKLPQDLADSLAEAGFYRTLVPPTLGGLGLSPTTVAQVSETLATGNASAAWCTFIGATSQIMFAALTPEQLAEVLRNPDVITAGVFASSGRATPARGPDGTDGYFVSGRWAWASGCHNAEWISGGVLIDQDENADGATNATSAVKPAEGRAFFRPTEIVIHDDWHTSGLRGSGSSTLEAHDVWLPALRIAKSSAILRSPHAAEPLYRFPLFGLLALPIGAIALGMARASIDEVIDVARTKVPQGSRRTLAQRPSLHTAVAVADTKVRAARVLLYETAEAAWQRAQTELGSLEIRRELRTATVHATQTSVEVIEAMNTAVGGTAIFESSPLQRHLRDIQTASAHFMVTMPVMELAGRTMLVPDTDSSGL